MAAQRRDRVATSSPDDHFRIRFSREERDSLRRLAASADLRSKRLCLSWIWCGDSVAANRHFIVELLEQLAWDPREPIRYGALLVLGDIALEHPERVWPVVERLGAARSVYLREALAVCTVEWLIGRHPETYLPKIEEKLRAGDPKWARTLAHCWIVDRAKAHADRIHALLDEFSTEEERTLWIWGKAGPPGSTASP